MVVCGFSGPFPLMLEIARPVSPGAQHGMVGLTDVCCATNAYVIVDR